MPNAKNSRNVKMSHVQRRKQIRKMRNKFFFVSFVVILILAAIITAIIELPQMLSSDEQTGQNSVASSSAQNESDAQTDTSSAQSENTQQGSQSEQVGVSGVIGPQKAEISYTVPTAQMLALPENGRVDMSYFADAVFVGDSLTLGFQTYASGIVNTNYAAYTGAGPRNIMEGLVTNVSGERVAAIDEIKAAGPKKVYVQLGMNVLASLEDEAFLLYYENMMVFLQENLPQDTLFYLQAITPVTKEKSEEQIEFSNERIRNLNESLAKLAYDYGWNYVDLYSALSDESQNLREDITAGSDGIHLNDLGYNIWREYLITHAAYSDDNPYIAGSPYM